MCVWWYYRECQERNLKKSVINCQRESNALAIDHCKCVILGEQKYIHTCVMADCGARYK